MTWENGALATTRELAVQINGECDKFGKFAGVTSTCVYGGAPIGAQQTALSKLKPTVVVATPGRLCDLLTRGNLSLGEAKYVVLDEADRMLDMGFEPQIRRIVQEFGMPEQAREPGGSTQIRGNPGEEDGVIKRQTPPLANSGIRFWKMGQ